MKKDIVQIIKVIGSISSFIRLVMEIIVIFN